MASIDWSMVGLGALIGVGCRKQLRAAGRVAASTAAQLAGVAASAAASVAKETAKETKSPEQAAADEVLKRIDQQIERLNQELGIQADQNPNG